MTVLYLSINETNSYILYFQNSMNLPPDKARLLRQYDNEKKWDLICDQVCSEILIYNQTCTANAHKPHHLTHSAIIASQMNSFVYLHWSSGEVSSEESTAHLHPENTRILRSWSHTKGGELQMTLQTHPLIRKNL